MQQLLNPVLAGNGAQWRWSGWRFGLIKHHICCKKGYFTSVIREIHMLDFDEHSFFCKFLVQGFNGPAGKRHHWETSRKSSLLPELSQPQSYLCLPSFINALCGSEVAVISAINVKSINTLFSAGVRYLFHLLPSPPTLCPPLLLTPFTHFQVMPDQLWLVQWTRSLISITRKLFLNYTITAVLTLLYLFA